MGNSAVSAVVHGAAASVVVQRNGRKTYADLLPIKQRNDHELVRTVLGANFGVWGWRFPSQRSGDGIMGRNTISASRIVTLRNGAKLAYHVNFMITATTMTQRAGGQPGRIVFDLRLLHLTARSAATQTSITEDGPSILTAAASVHCGPGNGWDWTKPQATELALKVDLDLALLQTDMANAGFDQAYMAGLRDRLKEAIADQVKSRLDDFTAEFTGDGTWI